MTSTIVIILSVFLLVGAVIMAWWFENGPGKKEPKNQEGEER